MVDVVKVRGQVGSGRCGDGERKVGSGRCGEGERSGR